MKLDPPSIVTLKDDISVGISAKYTFGKGVQGKATVLAEYPYYSSEAVKRQRPPIEKEIDVSFTRNKREISLLLILIIFLSSRE